MIYDSKDKIFSNETEEHEGILRFLYQNSLGKMLLALIVHPLFSQVLSVWNRSIFSKYKIQKYVEKYQINLNHYQKESYVTFADFFLRQYKKEFIDDMSDSKTIYAPCQGKLMIVDIQKNSVLTIKGQEYSLESLLESKMYADIYQGGKGLIYRLSLQDYHRFHYAIHGEIRNRMQIKGKLHSIREIAQRDFPVFKENKREYCVIESEYGELIQMEIGALTIGKIHNYNGNIADPNLEKGYFTYGGSTIMVLFPKGPFVFDPEIITMSNQSIEYPVNIGEKVGKINV